MIAVETFGMHGNTSHTHHWVNYKRPLFHLDRTGPMSPWEASMKQLLVVKRVIAVETFGMHGNTSHTHHWVNYKQPLFHVDRSGNKLIPLVVSSET